MESNGFLEDVLEEAFVLHVKKVTVGVEFYTLRGFLLFFNLLGNIDNLIGVLRLTIAHFEDG